MKCPQNNTKRTFKKNIFLLEMHHSNVLSLTKQIKIKKKSTNHVLNFKAIQMKKSMNEKISPRI
jgi:hypothetical protein